MIRRLLLAALLLGPVTSAQAAYGIDQLMADLASSKGGRARFVEKRHVALLDKPVEARGEMIYTPPDRLEKRTLVPRAETLVLDNDRISIERDNRKLTINLGGRPEALAFVDSMRSLLSGKRDVLQRQYALSLTGDSGRWILTMLPSDPAVAAVLLRITVSGSRSQVRHIDYLLVDGDRLEIAIEPLEAQ